MPDIRKSVPCELCGDSTIYTGTKRCDRCYELETRIKKAPGIACRILLAIISEPVL
jgi:hypothetical protein